MKAESTVLCPICSGTDFLPLTTVSAGAWRVDGDGRLDRVDHELPLGSCRSCGHVRVTVDYDAAFLEFLYGSDRIVGDDQPSYAGAETIAFCQPEVLAAFDEVVDLGCGRGGVLRALLERYHVPRGNLLGIDFTKLYPEDIPFTPADLNGLGKADARLPHGTVGMAFCTHVLEHIVDPRAFIHAVRAMLRPGGYVYVEVPNFQRMNPDAVHELPLVLAQHIHYFSERSLSLLIESCGFDIVRQRSRVALQMLARRREDASVSHVVRLSVEVLANRRARVASMIVADAEAGRRVGLWGLGADFTHMLAQNAALRALLAEGRIPLFDLLHAGRSHSGVTIDPPERIGSFEGQVYLLPSIHLVSDRMRAYARSAGWPAGRVVDPWRNAAI